MLEEKLDKEEYKRAHLKLEELNQERQELQELVPQPENEEVDDDYWALTVPSRILQRKADREAGNPKKKRKCRLCPARKLRVYNGDAYRMHITRNHRKLIACFTCGRRYHSQEDLWRHTKICNLLSRRRQDVEMLSTMGRNCVQSTYRFVDRKIQSSKILNGIVKNISARVLEAEVVGCFSRFRIGGWDS